MGVDKRPRDPRPNSEKWKAFSEAGAKHRFKKGVVTNPRGPLKTKRINGIQFDELVLKLETAIALASKREMQSSALSAEVEQLKAQLARSTQILNDLMVRYDHQHRLMQEHGWFGDQPHQSPTPAQPVFSPPQKIVSDHLTGQKRSGDWKPMIDVDDIFGK